MKLRNKKTGEICLLNYTSSDDGAIIIQDVNAKNNWDYIASYQSLAELSSEWEDAPEESKVHWCITMYGGITRIKDDEEPIDDLIEIGNYFNSKEDAYDAWVKLKAWKQLKDKGFRFTGVEDVERTIRFEIPFRAGYDSCEAEADLDICFGGEE